MGNKGEINLSLNLNNVSCVMLYVLMVDFRSDTLGKPSCDSKDCMNNIAMFCVQCKSYICNTSNNAHTKHQPTLPIDVGKDKSLKVLCNTHNTTFKYMCCNKHTCTYCIHRDNAKQLYSRR